MHTMELEKIILRPVAMVRNGRSAPGDYGWKDTVSTIQLVSPFRSDALTGIEDFSHVEILFHFHLLSPDKEVYSSRYPRDNPDFPLLGIFAQRGAGRPNRIGATVCRLISRKEDSIIVSGLDAVDGTPVLDIKPVFLAFLPQEEPGEPGWVSRLMKGYF